MQACVRPVRVIHWRPAIPFRYRDTVAVTDPQRPFTILYNRAFLSNPVAAKVNALVHEFVHNVDLFADGSDGLQYTHPRRATDDRPHSALYRIGRIAQAFWSDTRARRRRRFRPSLSACIRRGRAGTATRRAEARRTAMRASRSPQEG